MRLTDYTAGVALWSELRETAVMTKDRDNATAYSWIRYSTAPQEQGDSIRRQTSLRDAWLQRHPGVSLDQSLRMPKAAVSGFKGEQRTNPKYALTQFLDLVERGRVLPGDFLIVENLDRLTREHPVHSIPFVLSLVQRGVRVVQLVPTEVVYDSQMDEGRLMMLLWDLARGHGESKRKSGMLVEAWAEKKRRAREGVPYGKQVPRWLELRSGEYRLIPERAKIVRSIYSWSAAGLGISRICKRLNEEKIPPFGRKPYWARVYVDKILKNRAAIGEYQPGKGSGSRETDGDAIPGYFPAVVSEAEWHAAQNAKRNRSRRCGRPASRGGYTSPFAGLLFSAEDGEKLRVRRPHGIPFVLSAGRADGRGANAPGRFPLHHLVEGLLSQLAEIAAADLFNDPAAHQVQEIEGKLGEVERRLEIARQHFRTDPESAVWAEEVTVLDKQRRALLREREQAKRAAANPASATWSEAVDLMKRKDPTRLRQCLLATVEQVWCLFVSRATEQRLAAVQVRFVGGGRRDYLILSTIPTGWHARKRKAAWAAYSLADQVKGTFDLSKPAQARKAAAILGKLDVSDF